MNERRKDSGHLFPSCPATAHLRRWLNDKEELSCDESEHIANCTRCQAVLLTLTDDPSLRELESIYKSVVRREFHTEPEFQLVKERLGDLARIDFAHNKSTTQTDSIRESAIETVDEQTKALSIQVLNRGLPSDRFIVEELIATGGSGAVYKAFDQKLSREVAIKVLSRASMRDRQRFQREAKILAELEHPHIIRVFDVGELNVGDSQLSQSPLYIVLEHMSGGSARSICEFAYDTDSTKETNLDGSSDFVSLAKLISQAADGLSFAHNRGMIHRDIKPGNLLLNENRTHIKVADFGLARAHSAEVSLATRTGDLMGTPAFMSPEQLQNPDSITAQTDIYSLGASLYQMLTGELPYRGNTASTLRQIVDSSPIAPRLLNPSIPVDLETICLHAMERDPKDRYRNMNEFADDLRRFCAGDPISAKPVSALSHVVRYMRQNRGMTSLIATCMTLLVFLTVGSVIAAIVLNSQRIRLMDSEANERLAKEAAVKALRSSVSAADDLLLAVTTETEFLPQTTGSQKVIRKLLEKARDYYKEFLTNNADDHSLKLQLAKAHAGLAEVASRMGERDELHRESLLAIELIEQVPESEMSDVQRAILIADIKIVLANHFTEAGEPKLAIPLLDQAISDLVGFMNLEESDPQKDDWQSTYTTSLLGIANAYTWIGDRERALPLLEEAKKNYASMLMRIGDSPSLLRNAAACDITFATTAIDLQRPEEGRHHLLDAEKLLAKIPEDDVISLRVREMRIRLLTNLALTERRLGNNVEAKAYYQAAMEQSKRLMELEPSVTSHQWNLVVASLNSGGPDMELGLHEDLLVRWRETIPVLQKLVAQDPGNQRYQQVQAMLQSNIAIILRDLGKWEEAIEPLESATEILVAQAQALDFASTAYLPVSLNYYELARTYAKLDRLEDAERELVASDRVADDILLKDQAFVPARIQLLDNALLRFEITKTIGSQDLEEWVNLSRPTLALARLLVHESPETLGLQRNLSIALLNEAEVLIMLGEYQQANSLIDESMDLLRDQSKLPSDAETEQDQVVERGLRLQREVESKLRDPD